MLGHSRIIENDTNEQSKKLNKGRIKQKNVKIFAGRQIFQEGQKMASRTNFAHKNFYCAVLITDSCMISKQKFKLNWPYQHSCL